MYKKITILLVIMMVLALGINHFITFPSKQFEKGIDISEHQGTIDFHDLSKENLDFIMIRSSYGTSVDQYFETNFKQASNLDVSVGIYHYIYATDKSNAIEEVNFIIQLLKNRQFELPIFLDIEEYDVVHSGKENLSEIVDIFITNLENEGFNVGYYTNLSIYLKYLDTTNLKNHPCWIAQYSETLINIPKATYWQYSNTGKIKGISGDVDLNYKLN